MTTCAEVGEPVPPDLIELSGRQSLDNVWQFLKEWEDHLQITRDGLLAERMDLELRSQ